MVNLLPGISNSSLPGIYAYIQFAQGAFSGASASYNALIIGSKLAAGSASTNVVYGPDTTTTMSSQQDAINLFGAGSEAQRMVSRFLAVNTSTPLYVICPDGYGGTGSGSSSTGTIVVSGTATSGATLNVYVADAFVSVGVSTGDTAIVIATNIVAAINSQNLWPVTAANSGGTSATVTLTAKQQGLRTNFIAYQVAFVGTTSVGVSVSPTADTYMSGGTTTDSNANVLSVIDTTRYYYIISAAEDATNLGRLQSQIDTQALPTNGIRQRFIAGSQAASVSTVNTIAVGLNDPRGAICWQQSSDWAPAELAANLGAVVSLVESAFSSSTLNFDSFGANANTSGLWNVNAPRSNVGPTKIQQQSAIQNGVSPVAIGPSGSSNLVQLVTCYSLLNAQYPDPRVRDWAIVSICDRFTDDLISQLSVFIGNSTVSQDPSQNQVAPPGSVTPTNLKTIINRLVRDYGDIGLLTNVGQIISQTVVTYDPVNAPNTLSAVIPLQPIPLLHIIGLLVQQVFA